MIDLDKKIETLQTKLNANLWTAKTYTAYHRAFVNLRDGLRVPEVQIEDSTEYADKLLDDNESLSFFVVDPIRAVITPSTHEATVYLYFAVNLDHLYSVTERAEEYLIRDVTSEVRYSEFQLQGIKTGLTAFTDDFDFVKEGDNMEPMFLVRFETLVEYTINEC